MKEDVVSQNDLVVDELISRYPSFVRRLGLFRKSTDLERVSVS